MIFEVYEITRERKGNCNYFIKTMRRIATRNESEVDPRFHDMKLCETRELNDGFEIFRSR